MAKLKNRIPLGDAAGGKNFNNPFGALSSVVGPVRDAPVAPKPAPSVHAPTPAKGKSRKVSVHAERKGRGGKTVTIVRGLQMDGDALNALAKDMRQGLGCGATVEDEAIVLQGDQVDRARDFLQRR